MKRHMMVILLATSACGMQKQLQKAIAKPDLPKVELLLNKLKNSSPQDSTYLLANQKIDLDQLQTYAQQCEDYAQQLMWSRNNVHVYKRVALGVTTFSTGLLTAGYYFYHATTSGQSGSYAQFLSMLAASGTLIGHGVENIRMAVGNDEAHNLYAKYMAIKAMINKARHESLLDTSL